MTVAPWLSTTSSRRSTLWACRVKASRVAPERALRIWDLYLPACRRAFEEGLISVHQCLAAKPDAHGGSAAPLTREETLLPNA
jgi:cyclopropane-fatty-acyl-phospholipid synthase